MKTNNYIIEQVTKGLPKWVVESLKRNNCYIAGGAITSVVTGKEINDYDIYFPNRESLVEVVKDFREENPHVSFISDKSITYQVDSFTEVQFIYYDFYKTPSKIFKHFDYTCCMAAIDLAKDKVVMHDKFMLHNAQKYLDFNPKTKFPMISALRVQKYKNKGYKISKGQYMKILMAVNKLKLKSWEDFSAAVGNLYGFNFVKKERMVGEFSLDKAFDIIETTDFDGESIPEYKYDPEVVDLLLSDKPVKYCILDNGSYVADIEDYIDLHDLLETKAIKGEEVSVQEIIGDKIYKWVTKDLRSIHHSDFQYTLNEEAVAKKHGWSVDPVLYFTTRKDILTHSFGYGTNKVCIECTYNPEDIKSVSSYEIEVGKVVPVRVLTKEELEEELQEGVL